MKVGIATVPPGLFAGTRWTVAGLALLAWRHASGQHLGVPMRLRLRLVVVAILMVSLDQVDPALRAALRPGRARYRDFGRADTRLPARVRGAGGTGADCSRLQALALGLGVVGILVLFGPKALAGRSSAGGSGGCRRGHHRHALLLRPVGPGASTLMRTLPAAEVAGSPTWSAACCCWPDPLPSSRIARRRARPLGLAGLRRLALPAAAGSARRHGHLLSPGARLGTRPAQYLSLRLPSDRGGAGDAAVRRTDRRGGRSGHRP